ncbi:hypothetical protein N7520_005810 [Penicillium odoratum]|uniref:uncharacterized protein n=1 Tax=Penicillium odoratum TaxID=1167516 RepID=UPI002549796B|nr:uncharacterized protein N7520_005810 [Penicillium odoratum]KAJ5758654.1 hypothetical protein N7520_005810 [Penicillium odoratum]
MDDLPPEITRLILESFSMKHLLVITSVSRRFQAIAMAILVCRLRRFLQREYDSVFLRVGWYTPMKERKLVVTWAHQGTVALGNEKDLHKPIPYTKESVLHKASELAQVDTWYSIFQPVGPLRDPWSRPFARCWYEGDEEDCYQTHVNGYSEDDGDLGEEVTLESYEDFVQFRLRLHLAGQSGLSKPFKIENRIVRIYKDQLSQWSKERREYVPELVWLDNKKTIGLQMTVTRKQGQHLYEECTGSATYYVSPSEIQEPFDE